jgi:hypothetical protein
MCAKNLPQLLLVVTTVSAVVLSGCSPTPALSEGLPGAPQEAGAVVESFYSWHLSYPGNSMADGAYRTSEYLTGEFVAEVDELVASFDRGAHDPFLCAQDIPETFSLDEAVVSGEEATVVVHEVWNVGTVYEMVRDVDVSLSLVDGQWKIDGIACPVATPQSPVPEGPLFTEPEGPVSAFYSWYLWYAREVGNPLVDGAYRSSEYLTGEFVAEVDELVASFDRGAYDPFLCAQDIPETFSLDEAVVSGEEATIVVHEVWNAGTEFETVHDVEVSLHLLDGRWMLVDIECARGEEVVPPQQSLPEATPPEGWDVFRDETYGVEIQYPVEWTPQEVELRYPELDAPVVRIVHFLPQEWADQMNPAGPPDPHNVIVAPLGLEISVGSLEEYRDRYGEPATRETLEINGCTVVREQEALGDSCLVRYVFEHPTDETLRVTLVDQISGFSARAEGNAAVVDVVEQILSTFVFQW